MVMVDHWGGNSPGQGCLIVIPSKRGLMLKILDPCCGSKMMWDDRENESVIFGDIRRETITVTDRSHGNKSGTRTLIIEPDVMLDFRNLPYPDDTFNLVAFDPPHLFRAGEKSWMKAKYGKLSENWRDDIRKGFAECFRVLMIGGVLVFKWNETHVKIGEIQKLSDHKPLFGHLSGRKGLTHWLVYMKHNKRVGSDSRLTAATGHP